MKIRNSLILVAVLLLVFAAIRVPAPVVFDAAKTLVPANVRISGVGGSLWNGSVQSLRYRNQELGVLSWRFDEVLWQKLAVSYRISLHGAQQAVETSVELQPFANHVSLKNGRGTVEAKFLMKFVSFSLVRPSGLLKISIRNADLTRHKPYLQSLDGSVVWSPAVVISPVKVDFGQISTEFKPAPGNNGSLASMANEKGDISIKGTGSLDVKGKYQLELALRPNAGTPNQVRQFLSNIGSSDNAGARRIRMKGNI